MNHSIDSQALDLMLRAGSRWVLWLLIGLSIAATAVVLERLWFFARSRRQRQHIVDMLAALRKSGPEAARKALGEALAVMAEPASIAPPAKARVAADHTALLFSLMRISLGLAGGVAGPSTIRLSALTLH